MSAFGGRAVRDIVRAHIHDTTTYVFANAGGSAPTASEATGIQADILRAFILKKGPPLAGRRVVSMGRNDLARLDPTGSWLLVVLASSPEDVAEVARWVRPKGMDAVDRVCFYLSPKADLASWLTPWTDAGLPWPLADHWQRRVEFRAVIGRAINERIFQDFQER